MVVLRILTLFFDTGCWKMSYAKGNFPLKIFDQLIGNVPRRNVSGNFWFFLLKKQTNKEKMNHFFFCWNRSDKWMFKNTTKKTTIIRQSFLQGFFRFAVYIHFHLITIQQLDVLFNFCSIFFPFIFIQFTPIIIIIIDGKGIIRKCIQFSIPVDRFKSNNGDDDDDEKNGQQQQQKLHTFLSFSLTLCIFLHKHFIKFYSRIKIFTSFFFFFLVDFQYYLNINEWNEYIFDYMAGEKKFANIIFNNSKLKGG